MSWVILIAAGLLEVIWAIGLKYTKGFTQLVPSVITVVALVGSVWLLAVAARTLPIGTAYAVWVGIGATGAALLGIVLFHEPVSLARVLCLLLLVVAIVGLKLTTPNADQEATQAPPLPPRPVG